MEVDTDETWNKIRSELFQLNSELYDGNEDNHSLVKLCTDFEKNWDINIDIENLPFKSSNEVISEFDCIRSKHMRDNKKCVVLGRSSVGKSTFINALLAEPVLPVGGDGKSVCFLEIKGDVKNRMCLELEDQREIDIKELCFLNKDTSDNCLENGSHIDLFYDCQKCEFLNEDVIFLEVPGIDTDILTEISMTNCLQDSDAVILVINPALGISVSEINIFNRYQALFPKSNVLIAFNFWDVTSEDEIESLKAQCLSNAKRILCDELGYKDFDAVSNVFFVSAQERISIFTDDIIKNSGALWDARNDAFAALSGCLKKKLSENVFMRKYNCLVNLYSILSLVFYHCRFCISQMRQKRIEMSVRMKMEMNNLLDLNGKINNEMSLIFNEAYIEFLNKGLDELKVEIKSEEKLDYQNICYTIDENEVLNQRLEKLVNEIVEQSLEKLKSKIIDLVYTDDETSFLFRKKILTELYFPFYMDLSSEINFFDFQNLKSNLLEINRRIKIGSRVTIGLTAGAAAVGAATGGVAFAVIGLAEAALVAGGIASGGAIAGSAIGFGTSFGIIKAIKMPFRFAWKKYELNIKAIWDSFESTLTNSYATFLENITSNITLTISVIEDKSKRIEHNLNNVKEELKNFQNYSLIY